MGYEHYDDGHHHDGETAAAGEARTTGFRLLGSWLLLAVISWLVTGALVSGVVWFAHWLSAGA